MNLSKKNLIYSLTLAGILMVLVIGYFIFMLPSLYVDYVSEQNLQSVKNQHQYYLEHGNYDNVSVINPAGCYSIEVPLQQNYVYVTNKALHAKVQFDEAPLSDILQEIQERILVVKNDTSILMDDDFQQSLSDDVERWKQELTSYQGLTEELPFSISVENLQDYDNFFTDEQAEYHLISDQTIIVEASVHDQYNGYTNYLAITAENDRLVISYLPVMTPKMAEILPVVLQSIPMIAAVLVLLVLLFSQVYSRGIVNPIVSIVVHTQSARGLGMKGIQNAHVPELHGCTEITLLAGTLNELYEELRQSYTLLEEKNRTLAEENERKEVFLRASSHQLKTPIAAALLLLDGMINQIGRYKDTTAYLPQVKHQLISMKNIVDDILYLNHCDDHICFQRVNLDTTLTQVIAGHSIVIEQKHLTLERSAAITSAQSVLTDYNLFYKVLDNLIANAVAYTPEGERIEISLSSTQTLEIVNYGVTINESLLPHIFEPFVTGNQDGKCHGLGLYIVSYYAKKIYVSVKIENLRKEPGVRTELHFDQIPNTLP